MIKVGGFELRSLTIGLRWCRRQGFPENLAEWGKAENVALQWICEELDRRREDKIKFENRCF